MVTTVTTTHLAKGETSYIKTMIQARIIEPEFITIEELPLLGSAGGQKHCTCRNAYYSSHAGLIPLELVVVLDKRGNLWTGTHELVMTLASNLAQARLNLWRMER